jgi:sortase (surface protein transpeptidase)
MANPSQSTSGNRLLALAAVALATAGVAELGHAGPASGPPRPAANVVGSLPNSVPHPDASAQPAALPYSPPAHVDIPAVNLHASIIKVDLNADQSLGTPPLGNAKVAGWYDRGPTPGQVGSAILDAHVDSALMSDYRGAFYYLGLVKPGMEVDVARADGIVALFRVDEIQVAAKADFPTAKVYAATAYPALRLITCGGDYDKQSHEYLGNTIVYAHFTGERRTS